MRNPHISMAIPPPTTVKKKRRENTVKEYETIIFQRGRRSKQIKIPPAGPHAYSSLVGGAEFPEGFCLMHHPPKMASTMPPAKKKRPSRAQGHFHSIA